MPERSFGRTIRYRRTKLGLSQAKLGDLVGRSASAVRLWEKDESYPSEANVIEALAAVLGIDERLLFEKAGMEAPRVESSPTVEEALATLSPMSLAEPILELEPASTSEPESEPEPEPEPERADPHAPSYLRPSEPYTVTAATPPLVEPSYLEDSAQRQLYWVRQLATIVALVALGLAFLWAISEGLSALSTWWDNFVGVLRL